MVLVGGVCKALVARHVLKGSEFPTTPHTRLATLPHRLGDWVGRDNVVPNAWQYGDERVLRTYVEPRTGHVVRLWMVSSSRAEDRLHHPEVCYAVAGRDEDRSARRDVDVGPGVPVQRLCFGEAGSRHWVFYWHYTLPRKWGAASRLQRWFRSSRSPNASVTLQVFVDEFDVTEVAAVQEFVQDVDEAVRDTLGPRAIRGSERLPVLTLRDDPLHIEE